MRPLVYVSLVAGLLLPAAGRPQDIDISDKHWSLRPRTQASVPHLHDSTDHNWLRTPVDAFILARLRKEGLSPAREADWATLSRRLTFDLTGLPPTPAEIEAFREDRSPDAYERLVDRLLASPHYGERWGQHWLDVVRYAETEGFEYDRERPGAWRYRDYVIAAFNTDKPYDRFVREQLAGDEIDADDQEMQVAVGFHRLGPVRRNAGNAEVAFSRNEVLTEQTDIIGSVFLGLTVGCARCHDHKFDDISQKDYYRLQAFLAATQEHDIALSPPEVYADWKVRTGKIKKEIQQLTRQLDKLDGDARTRMEARIKEAEERLPPPLPTISSVRDAEPTPIHVLKRGDHLLPGKLVGPRILSAFLPESAPELAPETPRVRTRLAAWLTDPAHPLTARVIVNRLWQYHFGTGLVATANDFGVNGSPPSHPELLDYLANELVAHGWRLKPLHRLIVLSSTYRMSSINPQSIDPHNRLLARFPRRRLSAEEIRDAMLSAAERLNTAAGGPSVVLPVENDLRNLLYKPSDWTVSANVRDHLRRSVYLVAKRNLRLPFAEVFDQPDAQTSCARRESSTHAPQALELLNGKTSTGMARAFADRLQREAGADHDRQIELAYLLIAGRKPSAREQSLARAFLERQPLSEFALAMFNLNAFLYVE